jgi:hypothetical protein
MLVISRAILLMLIEDRAHGWDGTKSVQDGAECTREEGPPERGGGKAGLSGIIPGQGFFLFNHHYHPKSLISMGIHRLRLCNATLIMVLGILLPRMRLRLTPPPGSPRRAFCGCAGVPGPR